MFKEILSKMNYIFDTKQKKQLFGVVIVLIISSLLELIAISAIYPFINVALDASMSESNIDFLFVLAIGIMGIYLIKNVFAMYVGYFVAGFQAKNQKIIAMKMLNAYMQESYTFHLNKNSATLFRNMTIDLSNFFLLVFANVTLLSHVLLGVILTVYLFYLDVILTSMLLLIMIFFILFYLKLVKHKTLEFGKRVQENNGKMNQWLNQAFGGIKEIKISRREKYFVDNYSVYAERLVRVKRIYSFMGPIPRLMLETVCVAVILLIVVFKLNTSIDAATYISKLAVFAMALFRLFPRIAEASTCFNDILFLKTSMDLLYNDLKEIEQLSNSDKISDTGVSLPFEKDFEMQNVSYVYPNTEKNVFEHVNIRIKKGEAIAFIGPSGAGKTTLVDVLLGILLPVEGNIYVDGRSITENPADWSRKLGYIPQNIYLIDDTIRNNITFGFNASIGEDTRIWEAAEGAQLGEFIRTLPEGIDTQIGERGVRLSGGQRQRIGIARALYNNLEILVLDEATSALDHETEAAVMGVINNLRGTKTIIMIAHRLSTIKNCDTFYKVENGKVTKIDRVC